MDNNGHVMEELLDEKNRVCLNDGHKTRIDVITRKQSVLDLTLVSNNIASICDWSIKKEQLGVTTIDIIYVDAALRAGA